MSDIEWHDVSLGVITWRADLDAYVLTVPRRDDLPNSFNVWTKVGQERAVRVPLPAKAVLGARGLRQSDLAREIGVNPNLVCAVLNGRVAPWPAFRRRVAATLNLPEAELFGESEIAAEEEPCD